MSLPSSTLSAIQKAGAAVFAADERLKKSVKDYAERVSTAVAANPFNLNNDSLMEDWKTAARLSQTFTGIEAEIKKAFQIATKLSNAGQPSVVQAPVPAAPARAVTKVVASQNSVAVTAAKTTAKKAKQESKPVKRAPAAPTRSSESSMTAPIDLSATEAVIKPKKKPSKPKTSASKSTPGPIVSAAAKTVKAVKPVKTGKVAKVASVPTGSQALSGNPAKLFTHLAGLLNADEFTAFSQTAASRETGIPLGSMTAATKKLLDIGRIVAGPAGSFKLAEATPPLAQ